MTLDVYADLFEDDLDAIEDPIDAASTAALMLHARPGDGPPAVVPLPTESATGSDLRKPEWGGWCLSSGHRAQLSRDIVHTLR
jgi:hypothetical protein